MRLPFKYAGDYDFPFFGRYIVVVFYRCYRNLCSGKRYISAASQTEPEFAYKEENLQQKFLLHLHPEEDELPKKTQKQCKRELIKAEPVNNQKDEDPQIRLPSPSKTLPPPQSGSSPASASEKQVSGLKDTSTGTACVEKKQVNEVEVSSDFEKALTKKSQLCYDKSYNEDDVVLMKLKNESQVHRCELAYIFHRYPTLSGL